MFWDSTMFGTEMLVYAAGACYVLGLLIINQRILRFMLLLGTLFYILYYWYVAESPLWEAIYISGMIGMANLFGMVTLEARKSRFAVPRAHRDIYDQFPDLPPGDFRALMRCAKRYTLDCDTQLTTEGASAKSLFYAVSGRIEVNKRGDRFVVPAGSFLGELSFLTRQNASATTMAPEGTEILEWSASALHRLCQKSAQFKMALEATLSVDMAKKLSYSVAPYDVSWRPEMVQTSADYAPALGTKQPIEG